MQLPKFNNKQLLQQAFTHRSYLNETRENIESNERLEFLGDSILSFVVSNYLYETYPKFDEGTLTNLRSLLVNTKSLAESARQLKFGDMLRLSKGEEESKGRQNQSLLADCFEAYIGALFLDQGLEAVNTFILQTILEKIKDIITKKSLKDPKSLLQEYVQSQKQKSPVYKVINEEGPAHAKTFTVGAYIDNILQGKGIGKSKQQAEEYAANVALEKLQKK
ncbi:MAG: ribonuclease III [Candidatus Levyibacteriota bacterium]|nr:MAG: ribonuclease III [Candidatus Levybacteria bacterium]